MTIRLSLSNLGTAAGWRAGCGRRDTC